MCVWIKFYLTNGVYYRYLRSISPIMALIALITQEMDGKLPIKWKRAIRWYMYGIIGICLWVASVVILQHLTGKRVDFILKHMSMSLFEMSSKLIKSVYGLGWLIDLWFIRWLHNETLLATAQKQHVFIYDQSGLEIHRLKHHQDVNKLEFLPYHFLLASVVCIHSCILYTIRYDW